jgi:hypothetical protein
LLQEETLVLRTNIGVDHDLKQGVEVVEVSIRGDELEWYVTTEDGKAVINTRGRRNVMLMDHKVILVDPYDNISEIDLDKMVRKILRIINRTI